MEEQAGSEYDFHNTPSKTSAATDKDNISVLWTAIHHLPWCEHCKSTFSISFIPKKTIEWL